MTTAAPSMTWVEESAMVCGGTVRYRKGGSGPALLVLPRDNGHPPRTECLDALAASNTVYYPLYPGFHGGGPVEDWEWVANVRDLAVIQAALARAIGICPVRVLGLGFGGYVAAEMATMAGGDISALILVSPMGIRVEGEFIHDQFISSTEAYARQMFGEESAFDALYSAEPGFEQLEGWETDREMVSRIAWKPYMHNRSLPRLLAGVSCPALVLQGDADTVVPPAAAKAYSTALPNARLEVLPGCGHAIELEHPAAVAAATSSFLKTIR